MFNRGHQVNTCINRGRGQWRDASRTADDAESPLFYTVQFIKKVLWQITERWKAECEDATYKCNITAHHKMFGAMGTTQITQKKEPFSCLTHNHINVGIPPQVVSENDTQKTKRRGTFKESAIIRAYKYTRDRDRFFFVTKSVTLHLRKLSGKCMV